MKKPYIESEYDEYILSTVPYVKDFYRQAISMIRQYGNTEGSLLDLGCGTGMFEELLRKSFPKLSLTGIDPSNEMQKEAERKQIPDVSFHRGETMDLDGEKAYDIITAIMVHHLMQPGEREIVTEKIFWALKAGGIYISYENVVPEDGFLKEKELDL